MGGFIFIVMFVGVFIFGFFAGFMLQKVKHGTRHKKRKDAYVKKTGKSTVLEYGDFSGLGIEPVWKGELPEMVKDYVKPRYVYETGVESEKHSKRHGRVIGYRISPTLVIHSMVAGNSCFTVENAEAFKNYYLGEFLNAEEVEILRENWKKVSRMREDIGEMPLPTAWFWGVNGGNIVSYHYLVGAEWDCFTRCNVILKR